MKSQSAEDPDVSLVYRTNVVTVTRLNTCIVSMTIVTRVLKSLTSSVAIKPENLSGHELARPGLGYSMDLGKSKKQPLVHLLQMLTIQLCVGYILQSCVV